MEYNFRTSQQHRLYRSWPAIYPRVADQYGHVATESHPSLSPAHPPPSSVGLAIRIMIKPEYRIPPLPQLSPLDESIPGSSFQFDFDFERKILAEAEQGSHNWGPVGKDNLPSRASESCPSTRPAPTGDPIISKYVASGLNPEAVPFAVSAYGDNSTKVQEFVNGYSLLREMGFPSSSIAEALIIYGNDRDKALAHFLNSSS
ncbi:hypothetical protein SAY87_027169 [Trapa incisa]|uniref:UBA domain-containing protein n=1 Tax=Trapa incisa TaxID=236973 RepID=A0AAN7GMZ1_9MYRT|nr:hypothetical protein SAY87_027169 [Trapa incisa]